MYNFDHPDAFDFDLMLETLQRLKDGKSVDVPVYNFTTHSREKHTVSSNIIIRYIYLQCCHLVSE
jgi:uridine kinase